MRFSLLITDIDVELEDGRFANVEVQKIGYNFPGQRSACYSADLLLRQYKRVRGEKGKHFSYKDIKNVYTIVLFEQSTGDFHLFPDIYLHYFEHRSDSGLELELLQKLLFFSSDDREDIIRVITEYPEFQAMYEQAYQMCRNVKNVMGIFSEELKILDRNTVQLMIDEMQDTINAQQGLLQEKDSIILKKDNI